MQFETGRVYYSIQYDDDLTQPAIISYRYSGKKDRRGRSIFTIFGAPPKARMLLEKRGESGLLTASTLVAALRKELKRGRS